VYCVIMAGGIGSRFWPMSRNSRPKQFIDVFGTGQSLLQQTFSRVTKFCPPENIFVVTSEAYRNQVLEHIPSINPSQVLLEPMRRNTAPCVAFANHIIAKRNPNALIVVAPSDHLILDEQGFVNTIHRALAFASANNALLTIGIKPSRPETGYGYIQINSKVDADDENLFGVKTFTEKPNLELAKVFLESGEFFWNSGVFIWSLTSISGAFDKYLPEVQALFREGDSHFGTPTQDQAVASIYAQCKNISIDYGIMEKADNVHVLCSEFGWSDLGTWGSLYLNASKDEKGNATMGSNAMTYGVTNSLIHAPKDKLIVVQGIDDIILVDTDNVLLICRKDNEQEVKAILNDVLIEKGDKFI
jgi:mannose-1-phosphate guanylyltransferase